MAEQNGQNGVDVNGKAEVDEIALENGETDEDEKGSLFS